MGLEQIRVLEQVASLEILSEELAKLQRTIRYLLNGNLDFMNIRAKGITAENIDVDKLSAIVADIGEVTAGIMRGIAIYGSYIATSEDSYPRAEMSETEKMFKVALTPTKFVEFTADHSISTGSSPVIRFVDGEQEMIVGSGVSITDVMGISANEALAIVSFAGVFIPILQVSGWSNLINNVNGRTLQDELNDLNSSISSLTSSVNTLWTMVTE